MMPALAITEAGDADLGLIRAVAAGQAVSIGPGLLETVQQRCTQARQALRDGQTVYGVNTGMGALSSVRLTEQQQLSHQRNLLLARATGGPPWLSPPEVRALFSVRLLTFLTGDAAVSAGLCQRLADFLNYGILPAVPRAGTAAAGEIIQLAHAFGPLVGIGQVIGPAGGLMQACEALSRSGLTEFSLGPKEGIALIQGVPGVTGLSVLRLDEAAARIHRRIGAPLVTALANKVLKDGKRSLAEHIVYGALEGCRDKSGNDPVITLKRALDNVKPTLEVKSRRVGGATYQVPVEVRASRSTTLALRWIVAYARNRREKTMTERLMNELLDASNGLGASVKRREDTHKMAESNKAFAHYRW